MTHDLPHVVQKYMASDIVLEVGDIVRGQVEVVHGFTHRQYMFCFVA
jgi:hypothetical protein